GSIPAHGNRAHFEASCLRLLRASTLLELRVWMANLYLGFTCGNADSAFNSAKASGQPFPTDRSYIGTLDKTPNSFTINPSALRVESQGLHLERGQQTGPVSISRGHTENWGESDMADASPRTDISTDAETDEKNLRFDSEKLNAAVAASDSSDRSKSNLDQKILRRLAQNREAARKSRLRKKAYVQQLESSRLKLTQLEQELQRARQQGIFISSSGDQSHSLGGNGNIIYFHHVVCNWCFPYLLLSTYVYG
ncbi:hypothetical protein Gorai_002096, partial [Gossypium raimondii]|nr:hypothetical protein [Gossypium raimondii]